MGVRVVRLTAMKGLAGVQSGDTGKGRNWLLLSATRAFRVLPPVGGVPVLTPAGDCGLLPGFTALFPLLLPENTGIQRVFGVRVGEIPWIKGVVWLFGTELRGQVLS